ncbi:hypothetical protein BN1723_019590, partial [Verticillium longisporum]
ARGRHRQACAVHG